MAGKGLNWIVRNLLAALVVVVLLIVGAILFLNVVTKHNQELIVPDLSNLTLEEARAVAEQEQMRIDVTDSVFVRRMKRGAVYRQSPVPGSKVKSGRRIALTINAVNAKEITMPDLVGYSTRQAKVELLSRGLVLGKLIYVQDMATNNVLRQLQGNREIEPGVMVESGTVIDLVVGLNSLDNVTYVPYLAGLRNLSAVEAIHDHSLNIGSMTFDETVKDYDDSLNAVVYRQVPEACDTISVNMGDNVDIFLTLDHSRVPVRETMLADSTDVVIEEIIE
jgi:beta-lactam-binding protein with PASTA domain